MRGSLGQYGEFQRCRTHQQEVERAILVIGGEQAIERQERSEQCANPEDRGADAAQLHEVGPDRERHQRHHDEEEQHAHQRAAAHANCEPHVTQEKR